MKFKPQFPYVIFEHFAMRKTEENTLIYKLDRSKILMSLILLFMFVCTTFALYMPQINLSRLLYKEDMKRSATEIVAQCDFNYLDREATQFQQNELSQKFPIYLKIDEQRSQKIYESFLNMTTIFAHGQVDSICEKYNLPRSTVEQLKKPFALSSFQEHFLSRAKQLLARGVYDSHIPDSYTTQGCVIVQPNGRLLLPRPMDSILTPAMAGDTFSLLVLDPFHWGENLKLHEALSGIVRSLFQIQHGNLSVDSVYRDQFLAFEFQRLTPIVKEVKRGERIVARNQIVSDCQRDMVRAYREHLSESLYTSKNITHLIQLGYVSLLMMLLSFGYLKIVSAPILEKNSRLFPFVFTLCFALACNAFLMVYGRYFMQNLSVSIFSYNLLPLALAPAVVTVILGVRVGLLTGLYVAIISSLVLDNHFQTLLGGILIAYVVSFIVRNASNYRNFFMRIFLTTIIVSLVMKSLQYITVESSFDVSISMFVSLFVNAGLTATLAILILFFMETMFGTTTDMSLMTFIELNNPLLHRLQVEAPGTYMHSLMVAAIAEQAALEIDANPIQTRVAALYHDIGKLANPQYFTENVNPLHSPHAKITPTMSAIVIINHVKEGLTIAIKNHLPQIARDAIAQHHGTDLVSYFYNRALETASNEKGAVDKKIFFYPGPRPRQKEIVIVALADACEASTRSIEKPTHAKIEEMVGEIIRTKSKNGQLDQAAITIAELARMNASFVKTLTSIHHVRISYPKFNDDEDSVNTFVRKI